MKKVLYSIVLTVLAVASSYAGEDEGGSKVSFNIGGGFSAPLGRFSRNYVLGTNLGATINIDLKKNSSLFIDGRCHSFNIAAGAYGFSDSTTLSGGATSIISVVGGAKYTLPSRSKIRFYELAGLGLCLQHFDDLFAKSIIVTPYDRKTVDEMLSIHSKAGVGLVAGSGLIWELSPTLSLFGEIRLVIFLGQNNFLPVVLGIHFKL